MAHIKMFLESECTVVEHRKSFTIATHHGHNLFIYYLSVDEISKIACTEVFLAKYIIILKS